MQTIFLKFTFLVTLALVIEPSSQSALELIDAAAYSPIQFRNQLLTDLFMLKDSLQHLQGDLNQLSKRLNTQTEIIRSLNLRFSLSENAIDKCEMTEHFYDIDSKLIKIKQKLQQVINDHDDEHVDKIDNIMHNVRRTSLECSMDGHDLFVAFQTNITAKLEKFDTQMAGLHDLEQRLINSEQAEVRLTQRNDELTQLLNEIKSKLSGQEEKLQNLELNLPLMQTAMQSLVELKKNEESVCKKQKCISQKILELTKTK